MSLRMELGKDSYKIVTEPGCAGRADEYLNLDRKVLVDVEVLRTLTDRQVAEGLAEALKMSVTFDRELFEFSHVQSGSERTASAGP